MVPSSGTAQIRAHRATCRQIRASDPKLSPLHETGGRSTSGASPAVTSTHSCTGSRRGAQTPSAATACVACGGSVSPRPACRCGSLRSLTTFAAASASCWRLLHEPALRLCPTCRQQVAPASKTAHQQPDRARLRHYRSSYALSSTGLIITQRRFPISPPARRSPPLVSR